MTIREIAERIDAVVYAEPDQIDEDLTGAFGSDMMSDVLAFAENRDVLLTGLLNPQIVRTAHMLDMRCIIIVRGKTATEEIKRLAAENRIALLETKLTMYEASGKLYEGGLGR
ncbi:MAG: DRTGG domain-containing protein [Clostridia bacterium]|nr:DRTGG domain-containing protein [Clostridia bacterium]